MRPLGVLLASGIAATCVAGQPAHDAAALVERLRSADATYSDWQPILEAGKATVPALEALLKDPDASVRASGGVLLYRLGWAQALDALDTLLDAKDESARKEAAEALVAFTGGPAGSGDRLPTWRAWWKRNRGKALATPPLTALYGSVTGVDKAGSLVATGMSARHGTRRGMVLNTRRGDETVCLLEIVFATPTGSVGRIVPLSDRTAPRPGDTCFWTKPQGE